MALRVLFALLGLSMTGNCSRVANRKSSNEAQPALHVPDRTQEMLKGWLHKQQYKYLIMTVPNMEVMIDRTEGNYADFKKDFMSCPGVCLAAYDFSWKVPRGGGFVQASEAGMFSWAPDDCPEGLSGMGFMKLKMQLPMAINALKATVDGNLIECNDEADLDPSWIVPKLKGGRMGSRKEKLNVEGMALWEQLTADLNGGAGEGTEHSGPSPPSPIVNEPQEPHAPTPREPVNKPLPSAPEDGFTALSHDEIKAMIQEKVEAATERKLPEIIAAAKAAAQQAVKEATNVKAVQRAKEATNDVASLAFQQGADSIEG